MRKACSATGKNTPLRDRPQAHTVLGLCQNHLHQGPKRITYTGPLLSAPRLGDATTLVRMQHGNCWSRAREKSHRRSNGPPSAALRIRTTSTGRFVLSGRTPWRRSLAVQAAVTPGRSFPRWSTRLLSVLTRGCPPSMAHRHSRRLQYLQASHTRKMPTTISPQCGCGLISIRSPACRVKRIVPTRESPGLPTDARRCRYTRPSPCDAIHYVTCRTLYTPVRLRIQRSNTTEEYTDRS